MVPDRSDIVWIDMDPRAGQERAGRRPALVLSPASYNGKTSLALLCPITTRAMGYPFEVALPADGSAAEVVLADQVRNFDWRALNATPRGRAPADVIADVIAKLSTLLALP